MSSPLRHLARLLAVAGVLHLGCASSGEPAPTLAPELFFAGSTHGRGVLERRDGSVARRFEVESRGQATAEGVVIDQRIRFDDGERRERRWCLIKTGPDRYRGTLTEASGRVRARRRDGALRLSYRLATVPFGRMRQSLRLEADGARVINEGNVRVLGIVVRRMHEIIERSAPAADDDR